MSKPRLGIYVPCRGQGGPTRYVDSILSGLESAEEFDVTIFGHEEGPYSRRTDVRFVSIEESSRDSVSPSPGDFEPNRQGPNRPALQLWKSTVPRSVKFWGGALNKSRTLARVLRSHPVDVFHTNNTGCEESAIAARLAGLRRVMGTFHVDSTYDLQNERGAFRHRALEHLSNHCLHRAIAVSEATKQDWVRRTSLRPDRVVTIHNGIDIDRFRRRRSRDEARRRLGLGDHGQAIVGGVGRLDEAKGFVYLIEAVARLAGAAPNLMLVLAGDGPLKAELTEKAKTLGIEDRVRFLGFRSDVQEVLDALDLFVLPSLCETLGYALLEAMATELPAIGARVGGIPEVIVPEGTGLLVPPRDAEALATAIHSLLGCPEMRARMGQAGRRRVRDAFSEGAMIQQTIDLYFDVLKQDGTAWPRRGVSFGVPHTNGHSFGVGA